MSRVPSLSLLALLAAAAFLPAAAASSLSVAIEPQADASKSESSAALNVTITLTVSSGSCPTGTNGAVRVDLAANATAGGDFTVRVNPAVVNFGVAPGDSVRADKTYTDTVTLIIENKGNATIDNATVTVTATPSTPDCGAVMNSAAPLVLQPASGSTDVAFQPRVAGHTNEPPPAPVPGPGLPIAAAALLALALVLRRRR